MHLRTELQHLKHKKNHANETPRLTRSTELLKAEAQALLISDALARARALSNIMNEYRRSRNDAKVIELSGLIRVALGNLRSLMHLDCLTMLCFRLPLSLILQPMKDKLHGRLISIISLSVVPRIQYTAYYNAARMLPAE